MIDSPYRALPGVDTVLATPPLSDLVLDAGVRTEAARSAIETARGRIAKGDDAPDLAAIDNTVYIWNGSERVTAEQA